MTACSHLSLSSVNHDEIRAALTFSISPADNLLEHRIIVNRSDASDLIGAILANLWCAVDEYRHRPHRLGAGEVRHVERFNPERVRAQSKGVFKNVQRIGRCWLLEHRFGILMRERDYLVFRPPVAERSRGRGFL